MGTLQKEVRAKMVSILTKEQKAQLKGAKKGGDKKKK
jgi:Spy/CpxP family protein refolding chaperone